MKPSRLYAQTQVKGADNFLVERAQRRGRFEDRGLSLIEISLVVAIGIIVTAFALPSLVNFQGAYRVHSDSAALQGYLSALRMRAATQYQPYRLDVTPSTSSATYVIEVLTQTSYNPFGTPGTVTYSAQSPAVYESGTQYFDTGSTISNCRPTGITAFPTPVSADPSTCTGTFYIYFNTRGMPTDVNGNALASGGVAVYVEGASGLIDAVTVSSGGAVQSWNYSPSSTSFVMR